MLGLLDNAKIRAEINGLKRLSDTEAKRKSRERRQRRGASRRKKLRVIVEEEEEEVEVFV